MEDILKIAAQNQKRAWEIIEETDIINIWESIGAHINLIGSVKTGLLMKNRDIDFHIYSYPLKISESFKAMTRLAENPSIKRLEYSNLTDTEEECIEWHVWYHDNNNIIWKMDMIHILQGSLFDGHMEKVSDRILERLTPDTKKIILKLKYDTPENEKIMGIEYYKAVLEDGIKTYEGLIEWRNNNPAEKLLHWIP